MFKKELLKFIRTEQNCTHNIHDTKGLKLLTRCRLGFSHLLDCKYRHNETVCSCRQDIKLITHFLLHCPNHHCARETLFYKANQVSGTITRLSHSAITKILLFGDNKLDFKRNKILQMYKIESISLTKRFSCPLFK